MPQRQQSIAALGEGSIRRIGAVLASLLVMFSLFAVALPAQAAPEITLTPATGPAGTVFTVKGSGYTPGTISIRWGSANASDEIATASTDVNGNWSAQAQVPATAAPGQVLVFACRLPTGGPDRCDSGGAEVDEARFLVTATTTTTGPSTTVTSSPPTTTTPASTSTDQVTTTLAGILTTTTPGHGAGSDDYTWWDNTTSTFPSYPYAGPTAPPPPPDESGIPEDIDYPDIRATDIEVTQGIQNLENAMPLVKGRRTYVRVYVDIFDDDPNITYVGETTSWPGVTGALGIWAGNQFLGTRWPEKTYITARQDGGDRANLDDSLYFRVPTEWTNRPGLRFTTLVWAASPNTIDEEARADNNMKTVFVDFHGVADVTVHPVPLHLHRSYHPTDEVRVYQGVFGGPGTYAVNSGGNLSAIDVVEGIFRYNPIASLAVEPWPSVLYPLNHANGAEWNLGPCQTTVTNLIPAGNPGATTYMAVESVQTLFGTDTELPAEFTKPTHVIPDRTELKVLDKTFDIDYLWLDTDTGLWELFGTMSAGGDFPVVGAPVFVTGCKPADYDLASSYGSPLTSMSLNRVWYDWDDTGEYFIGMVDPSLPSYFGGLASSGKESAWVKFNDRFGDFSQWHHDGAATMGHEVGHLTGLKHVACKDDDGDGQPDELKGGAIDVSHPMTDWFPDCRLAAIDPDGWYGFDVYHSMWGLPKPAVISNDPGVSPPNLGYPMMGYLGPSWSDPYHWCRMLSYYGAPCQPNLVGIDWNPPPPEPTDGAYGTPTGPIPFEPDDDPHTVALVTGTVDLSARKADLITVDLFREDFDLPPGFEDEVLGDETLIIEVFDEDDQLLYRAPLATETPHELAHVVQVSAEVVLKNNSYYKVSIGDEAVGVFEPSSSAPTATWVVQTAETDLVFLQWAMDDADGDRLLALVQYSNNGDQWMTLAEGYDLTLYESSEVISGLPGGDGRFRLVVNDGWNTTVLDGPRLAVDNKPPAGAILLPNPGFVFATNEEIAFEASVFDPEDRGIDPEQVVWTSSRDGEIGKGLSFDYAGLTPGDHEITLEASDSAGVVSVMVIPITVDPDVVKPLPDGALVETVTALLMASDDNASTTQPDIPANPDATSSDLEPALWLILGGVVVLGAAIVIGSMWNGRDTKPTG